MMQPMVEGGSLVGTTIGRFEIKRQLGAGGMGVVYLATDTSLHRDVALKLLPAELGEDPERRSRFLREARSAAQLLHPNIATVFEVGDEEGELFLAMELIAGRSVRELVSTGPLGIAESARIARGVARALLKAHGAGVVHRDLKPENVMVAEDGTVKVLDFGLAKLRCPDEASDSETMLESAETATNATAEGRVLGTPGYMSPEQARGQEVDHRTDLFALGVMLYEMLSGEAPFQGDTALDRLAAVTRDDPAPIADLPAELDELLGRCLAKDVEERIADAETFLDELSAAVGSISGETMAWTPRASQRGAASRSASSPRAATAATGSGGHAATEPSAELPATETAAGLAAGGPPSTLGPKAKLLRLGIGAALGIAVAAGLVTWRFSRSDVPSAPVSSADPATLWTDDESVLACPPLKASGVAEPAGWLGAVAADIACRRATLLMGGRYERTQLPAELLDMPTKVVASIPEDVYGDPESRPKAIEAAKQRATAWLDGSIAKSAKGFELSLVVRTKRGDEVARSGAAAKYVHEAVRDAMEPLLAKGAIPEEKNLDPEVAGWLNTRKPRAAVAALELDIGATLQLGLPPPSECDRVARHRADFVNFAPIEAICTESRDGPAKVKPPAIDRSSPEAFAWTAPLAMRYDKSLDLEALAAEARRLLDAEKSAIGRGMLGINAANFAFELGRSARLLSFAAVQDDPRNFWVWQYAGGASMRQKGGEIANRAFQTWTPEQPDAWNVATFADPKRPLADKIRAGERAVALSPDYPLFAQNLADFLVQAGRTEDVRSLAASLVRGGEPQKLGAEALLAKVEASEGKFEHAYDRTRAAHAGLEVITRLWWGDMQLTEVGLNTALVLDRHHELADELAERFVLADPPRLYDFDNYTSYQATLICLHASKPVAARCADRLHDLMSGDFFKYGHSNLVPKLLEGLRHYLAGKTDEMVKAWRNIPAPMRGWEMRARLLAEVGRDDLAQRVDDEVPVGHGAIHGASLVDVRRARRAQKRGDHGEARKLAQKVVDAWSDADTDVPAVAEMRALLKKLP